jgi:hypothetical protein
MDRAWHCGDEMKSTRAPAKKKQVSSRKAVPSSRRLPAPKPISAEKLREFERRFRPLPDAAPTDLVAHLIRLRGSGK